MAFLSESDAQAKEEAGADTVPEQDTEPASAENWQPEPEELPPLDTFGFKLKKVISHGSFTAIFIGYNKKTCEEVAVKFEAAKAPRQKILHESKVYKSLARNESDKAKKDLGVMAPKVHWCGMAGNYSVMVMDLLGPSLEDIFVSCDRKFGQRLSASFGLKILGCIEYLHSKGFVHGDIKPEHVAFNLQDLNSVHLIDFGWAHKYRKPNSRQHIAFQTSSEFSGDMNFASLNTHAGYQRSRRDDLESIAYLLLYFCTGSLPWMGLKVEHIKELKASKHIMSICPKHLATFLGYARNLSFEQRPSYSLLGSLLLEWEQSRSEKRRNQTHRWLQQRRLLALCSLAEHNFDASTPPTEGVTTPEDESASRRVEDCQETGSLPEYNFVPDWTLHLHVRDEVTCCPTVAVSA